MKLKVTLFAIIAGFLLQGCTSTLSHDITKEGKVGELVWPEMNKAFIKQGVYPSLEALELIRPGHTKEDLYALFGPPHHQEGLSGVKEWDYIFKFRQPHTNEPKICQYKVIFDEEYIAQSYFWNPPGCGENKPQAFTLNSELLFDFDKHDSSSIDTEGCAMIDNVARQLIEAKSTNIRIVGYTDPIGTDGYNDALSLQRANTVKKLLIERGVNPSSIDIYGAGKSNQVKSCSTNMSKANYIKCLKPNRRVTITAR